jgi:drug/metabolite transporter (DMT)-like permease
VSLFYENLSFDNIESGCATGFLLAIAGGFAYAFYIIRVDKSSLRQIPTPKITLAVCICAMLCSGIYGWSGFGGGLSFGLSAKGWVYAWIVALSVTLVAVVFLQLGIKYTGAPAASILSTFEPITSVLCGAFFLGEHLSFPKMIGCAFIITSVIIVATSGNANRVKN